MDRLWTPWRFDYITGAGADPAPGVPAALSAWLTSGPATATRGCVFCNIIAAVDYATSTGMPDVAAHREALIIERGEHVFVCLNRFPYSTGHLLIVPYVHCDLLSALPSEAAQDVMTTAQRVDVALHTIYRPDGLNFGLNLGEAAGAGVASHLHLHAVPRWSGDTNFMTVTAETRILPETLDVTWRKLRGVFGQPID